MKLQDGRIVIAFVCVLLGVMMTVQYKAVRNNLPITSQRATELAARIKGLENENKPFAKQIADPENDRDMQELLYDAGLLAVEGPGVVVTLDDSMQPSKQNANPNLYIIHDEDLLRIVNELRASGAEALSVNGQRLIGTSEIRCVGPNININGKLLSPPFEIRAIGDPQSLSGALSMRGGVKENLNYWGIDLQIKQMDTVVIPAFKGSFRHQYARVSHGEADKS